MHLKIKLKKTVSIIIVISPLVDTFSENLCPEEPSKFMIDVFSKEQNTDLLTQPKKSSNEEKLLNLQQSEILKNRTCCVSSAFNYCTNNSKESRVSIDRL